MQACNSIMCAYFCIGFIDFMLKGKSLLHYSNLFSPNDYEKNDNIILKRFQELKRCVICVICGKYRKFEKPKKPYLLEKTLPLSIICSNCMNEDEKYLKKMIKLRY